MSNSALKQMIDRMVEESIRRVLPSVMNEVLIRAAVSARAQTLDEDADEAPARRKTRRKRKPIAERKAKPQQKQQPKTRRAQKPDLSSYLDEAVGADFYNDPRSAYMPDAEPVEESYDIDMDDDEPQPRVDERLQHLPPELRSLAEGMTLDEDEGEMWGPDEHDSGMAESVAASDPNPIRDVSRAAQAVGVDFSRMKAVIGKTDPKKARQDADDARAKAQFEMNRIRMLQERLNKPVG